MKSRGCFISRWAWTTAASTTPATSSFTPSSNQEALDAYATHPAHLRVKSELGKMRIARFQVDYLATTGAL